MPAPRRHRPPIRTRALSPAALLAAGVLVVGALGACMPEEDAAAALRAAQADSAAAGYPVGATPDSGASARTPTMPILEALRRRLGLADTGSTPPRVVAIAHPVEPAPPPRSATGAAHDSARDSAHDSAHGDAGPAAPATDPGPQAPAADSAPRGADARDDSARAADAPDSLLAAGEFLSFNPARRLVQLTAVAGYNGLNESLNINGAARGGRTIVVPLGWQVEVRFRQGDEALAHSLLVAPALDPIPVDAPEPAFEHATTRRATAGMIEGATDSFAFVADRAGDFVLQCGVPGHAQGGMWLRLAVDPEAPLPLYR